MSKIVKITPEVFNSIVEEFKGALSGLKMYEGKISYSKSFDKVERTADLRFTEIAWLKMQALVREYDKEVAWHGVAHRGSDPNKDEYIISDILVYPQEVSGATVTTDQKEYQNWLFELDNDVFNNLRMQGHSHVNMSVTPSAVDTTLYESLLSQLDDTMFYIFLIWNKRGDKTVKIYDLAKNIMFDTSDIKVSIIDDGTGVEALLRDAKEKVKERSPSFSGYNQGFGNYGSSYSYGSSSYGNYTPPATKPKTEEPAEKANVGSEDKTPSKESKVINISEQINKRRKGKMKKGSKTRALGRSSNADFEQQWLEGFLD